MPNFARTLSQDVTYAFRQLRRSPGFALTAIITIALGIGANTAIFTLAHSVLLRRLPVQQPGQIYRIGSGSDCCINGGAPDNQVYSDFSTEMYRTLRDNLPEFEQLAATPAGSGNGPSFAKRAGSNDAAKNIRGAYVSGNYFDLFGITAHNGRLLRGSDDREGAPPVAVMSYATWQGQFGGDPGVVGATFLVDTHPVTVVGIAPQSFYGDRVRENPPDFYLPIAMESAYSSMAVSKNVNQRWLYLIGRVQPGTDMRTLQAKSDNVLRHFMAMQRDYQKPEAAKEVPKIHAEIVSAATGIRQDEQNKIKSGVNMLMAISGLVLLIACANIANLLLARGITRRAETSIRVALGAARSRIVQQALTESVVLAAVGAVLGVLLAYVGVRAMLSLAFPEARNLPISATPSPTVLLFTVAVACMTGMVFGAVPAWVTMRSDPADALRGLGRSASGAAGLPQRVLLVLQAMLSLVLITVAALLTRSLGNLQHQHYGLSTDNRIVVHLDSQASGYQPERFEGLIRNLQERLLAVPGTHGVGFANYSPLEGNNWGEAVFVEGRPDPTLHQNVGSSWDRVSPGFFQEMGQPLLRGRDFAETDRLNTPLVLVVNERFVRKFFPHEDPIGKRVGTEAHKFKYTIVGVVGDAKYQNPVDEANPMFFRSMLQPDANADPKDLGERYSLAPNAIILHTTGSQMGYEKLVRRAFQEVDPNLAIGDYRTMDSQVGSLLNDERMVARLTAAFGLLALLLASVGLYGVTAYSVAQRVPEIGVRMALGADRGSVLRMVVRSAMLQTLVGLGLGIPAALLAGHSLQAQLYGIKGHDLVTLLGACAVLGAAAAIASIIPARRASSVNPMRALRAQ